MPEPKQTKNRLHLDIYVDDPRPWIERALALGWKTLSLHDDPADWFLCDGRSGRERVLQLPRKRDPSVLPTGDTGAARFDVPDSCRYTRFDPNTPFAIGRT